MAFKTMVTELLWFLRGDTNIKYLVDNNCHIWDGDAYKSYENKYYKGESFGYKKLNDSEYSPDLKLSQEEFINKIKSDNEFAKKFGYLGPIYGKQWRDWENTIKVPSINSIWGTGFEYINVHIDQIANLINDLKTNPDSRRLIVSAWNAGELDKMVLPPCHYGFQVYTRELSLEEKEWQLEKTNCINDIENDRMIYGHEWEKYIQDQYEGIQSTQGIKIPTRAISLMWVQRSVDSALGWPYNVSSYSLLLMMLAKQVNMVPDEVICSLGDCHIYLNHIDGVKEQLTRESYPLPNVRLSERAVNDISEYTLDDIVLENYQSHPKIYFPLSN
jgi:thymidylate synthase